MLVLVLMFVKQDALLLYMYGKESAVKSRIGYNNNDRLTASSSYTFNACFCWVVGQFSTSGRAVLAGLPLGAD